MAREVLSENAPGDEFESRVKKAVKVYTSRGPSENLIGSDWDNRQRRQISELLESGREGFEIAAALAKSEHAKARVKAALHFGLCGGRESREELLRLMNDPAAKVRGMAVRALANLLYPEEMTPGIVGIGNDFSVRAKALVEGLEAFPPLLDDPDVKTRVSAVHSLGPCAGLGGVVDNALRRALDDADHKVRHAAAGWLRQRCPGCGKRPDLEMEKRRKARRGTGS